MNQGARSVLGFATGYDEAFHLPLSDSLMTTPLQSPGRIEPVDQTRLALATLAACLVKTLNETDPSFAARFEAHLGDSYHYFRDTGAPNDGVMETLKWTREIIRGK